MPSLVGRITGRIDAKNSISESAIERLLSYLSPIQRRFLEDPHRFKVARCSRRSGKTAVDAVYLIVECLRESNTRVLYAGLTRDSAKEAIWDMLLQLMDEFRIVHTPKVSTLSIEFPNGSRISLFGCDTENARNRLRGRKFKLVIFDETGFYAQLDPLIYAILPTLADCGGSLVLTSSPGELLRGLFYDADQGHLKDKWHQYFWTIHDNPLFQKPAFDPQYATRAEEELAIVLDAQFKGNAKHPGFRREWLGEWVQDATSLIYPFSAVNLLKSPVPMSDQQHAFGLSIGGSFIRSLVVGRYSHYSRDFQIVEQANYHDLTLDEFMAVVDAKKEKYEPVIMVADTGDFSPEIVEEIRRRYKVAVTAIGNRDRAFYQGIYATDLQSGHIKIVEAAAETLLNEYGKIVKDNDGQEIKGQENYAAAAALAVYRRVYQTTLQSYVSPKSEEDKHIEQLENSRFVEEEPWHERY